MKPYLTIGMLVISNAAPVAGDRVLLEHRVFRIHLPGAGQPDRISGERRALHAFPIENYSGGGFSHRVHRIRPDFFQNRDVPLEPSDGFRVHGDGGLFYF